MNMSINRFLAIENDIHIIQLRIDKNKRYLENYRKGTNSGKSAGPASGSKVGSGQTGGSAPKMHRRKSGSA